MFVIFDRDGKNLQKNLGDLSDSPTSHRLEDMANSHCVEHELEHNWKLFVENVKKSDHIAVVHCNTINKFASVRPADYAISEA